MKKAAEAAGVKTKGGLGRPVGGERYTRASRLVGHYTELDDAELGEPVGVEDRFNEIEAQPYHYRPRNRTVDVVETMPNFDHNLLQSLSTLCRGRSWDRPGASNTTDCPMRRKLTLLIATVVVALCLGRTAPAWAQEAAPYPVWWSPSLELESLDQIDSLLAKEFPEALWKVFARSGVGKKRKMIVDNCNSYLEATKLKYYMGYFAYRYVREQNEYARLKIKCETLAALKKTRSAKKSYLRDFVFTVGALDFLPEMVRSGLDYERGCEIWRANENGISWSQFVDFPLIDVASQTKMVVLDSLQGLRLEIVVRGDLDGDRLDDILLKSSGLPSPGGAASDIRLSVLTRFTADGVLLVLNPLHPSKKCNFD